MTENPNGVRSIRAKVGTQGRIAGAAYLVTIAAGLFAEVFVRGSIRLAEPIPTGERLLELEQLYRIGILADGLMLLSYVVVTALLYRLFKPVNPTVSGLAALFSIVGISFLAAALTVLLMPIVVQSPTAAFDALRLHGSAYNLSGLFFGPYCILIGWLALCSRWLPRLIGWLMIAAGAAFILDAAVGLAAPSIARQIPDAVMLISLLGEGALAVWLSTFGARASAPTLATD